MPKRAQWEHKWFESEGGKYLWEIDGVSNKLGETFDVTRYETVVYPVCLKFSRRHRAVGFRVVPRGESFPPEGNALDGRFRLFT